MALEKTGYTAAIQGTTKVNVQVDEDGYITPDGTQAAGTKQISIKQVNAENSLQDNTDVLAFFIDLANGKQREESNQMVVNWKV